MKKIILEFVRRGMAASGLGPVVLAVLYLVLNKKAGLEMLSVEQVCLGIFSLSVLAFIAGGMNVIYQVEKLPLMIAVLIQGIVLYGAYLVTYLLNDWLEWGTAAILVFSGIFVFGYLAIWAVIYSVIRKNTEKLNQKLKERNQKPAG
ncbi:MAG: DUF3021 domain-containing protein [Lachnospiraceae bacterium]|nr:DUF3021 domain-containing protein [Lachnospiraceae bacterium]